MLLSLTMRLVAAAGLGATALTVGGLAAPVQGKVADAAPACLIPQTNEPAAAARGGAPGVDHREITVAEQRAITRRTHRLLATNAAARIGGTALVAATVPVYVHVMRNNAGRGDVTNGQIYQQIAVLNQDFAQVGASFNLVDVRRYNNSAWHQDQQSARYRALTRLGGANALNIWLIDSGHLGIATFPWDYPGNRAVDGIRIDYESLPGGSIVHYNEGKTAVHEIGHWLGLFHTFQGGCTTTNDQVADTPAQATPTTGCPANRDSCRMPGADPIHNYMDYSWDSCYTEFTQGQTERINRMWAAYRA
ncbi:MAG TPA: zinc metalloprotease [Nocardioides sp.]|nr:zinc metalloprotease [Nocardioides sp.]